VSANRPGAPTRFSSGETERDREQLFRGIIFQLHFYVGERRRGRDAFSARDESIVSPNRFGGIARHRAKAQRSFNRMSTDESD